MLINDICDFVSSLIPSKVLTKDKTEIDNVQVQVSFMTQLVISSWLQAWVTFNTCMHNFLSILKGNEMNWVPAYVMTWVFLIANEQIHIGNSKESDISVFIQKIDI